MSVGSEQLLSETTTALERIQTFDTNTLARASDLGQLNFTDVIQPAQQVVDLYKRLTIVALQDFPDDTLTVIRDKANGDYNLFNQVLEFELVQENPGTLRTSLINKVVKAYQPTFQQLHPFISYSLHRAADFARLDSDARATLQSIQDQSSEITDELAEYEKEAKRVLEEIRNVAAEEGVTQQAIHFKNESADQKSAADTWEKRTNKIAIGLGVFAFLSFFIHKISWLTPESTYEAAQLVVSKVLMFSTIAYMLYLSARNFMNHKHNAIVNKHRQNALMTYRTLVEASEENGVKDAILLQAASSIFTPQTTGYANNSGDSSGPKSIVEILSKPLSGDS